MFWDELLFQFITCKETNALFAPLVNRWASNTCTIKTTSILATTYRFLEVSWASGAPVCHGHLRATADLKGPRPLLPTSLLPLGGAEAAPGHREVGKLGLGASPDDPSWEGPAGCAMCLDASSRKTRGSPRWWKALVGGDMAANAAIVVFLLSFLFSLNVQKEFALNGTWIWIFAKWISNNAWLPLADYCHLHKQLPQHLGT